MRIGCSWLPFSDLLLAFSCFPLDPLEIEDKNGVEDRNQQKGDEGSDSQSADLGIAERLPERATFECEWKQSKDRCAYRDHHRANALDPGIRKSALQRLALEGGPLWKPLCYAQI